MVLRDGPDLRWPNKPLPSAWPLVTTGAPDIDSDPGCYRATFPGMAFFSNPDPGDGAGHLGRPWWQHGPQMPSWVQVVVPGICVLFGGNHGTHISTDPDCGQTPDPGMVLGRGPGLDITMVPDGSTDHPNQPGPGYGTALGHNHGHRL